MKFQIDLSTKHNLLIPLLTPCTPDDPWTSDDPTWTSTTLVALTIDLGRTAGDRLCVSDDHSLSGAGTYTYRNYIHSALCGVVQVEQSRPDAECGSDGAQRAARTVTVVHDLRNRQEKLPTVGAVVTCRVVSIGSLQARCQISCVGQQLLRLPFRALLRKEDVRAEDKDRVEMHLCYRPRDIILAKVMGSSDQGYLLSTAEDELGVVVAYNEHS